MDPQQKTRALVDRPLVVADARPERFMRLDTRGPPTAIPGETIRRLSSLLLGKRDCLWAETGSRITAARWLEDEGRYTDRRRREDCGRAHPKYRVLFLRRGDPCLLTADLCGRCRHAKCPEFEKADPKKQFTSSSPTDRRECIVLTRHLREGGTVLGSKPASEREKGSMP
jgi:hypothetical protein